MILRKFILSITKRITVARDQNSKKKTNFVEISFYLATNFKFK